MSDFCDCGHAKFMHSGCTSWCMSICGCTAYRSLRDMPLCECGHEAALHPMIASYRSLCHAASGCSCQQYRQLTPTVVQQLVTGPIGIIMCDQCLTPHPRAFCPKRITADKENTLGKKKDDLRDLRADHDLMRDFVHRQNITVSKRLDTLEDTVADLTGRMGSREDAHANLVEALDDVVSRFLLTDECVAVLKDTVATLADCVENLNRAQESTTSILKTQHHLIQRLHKRVSALEDRRDAPRYEMPKDCHCGHMKHPGQRCLYRRELPGEIYECPCDDSPPTDESLTDRIANTLYQELSIELPAAIRGADAVIRALNLKEERDARTPRCMAGKEIGGTDTSRMGDR